MENQSAVSNGYVIDTTADFLVDFDTSESGASGELEENNPHRLAQRQKQVDYGKNTAGYQAYIEKVPKQQRLACHPQTPDVRQAVSKRGFDYQVKKWRRRLHGWDPKARPGEEVIQISKITPSSSPAFSTPRTQASFQGSLQSITPDALLQRRGSWVAAAAAAATPGVTPLQGNISPAPQGAWSGAKPASPSLHAVPANKDGKENTQALHGSKRQQEAFSPKGRTETKRPCSLGWADQVDAPKEDIYGDWDMDVAI